MVYLVRSFMPLIFALIDFTVLPEVLLRLAVFGLILLVTYVLSRVFGALVYRAFSKANPTFGRQIRRITTWLIWVVGVISGLGELGIDLTLLLVIVSLTGILLLFAIRDILANWGSYEAVSVYKPFKIGDWIQVGECFGRVVDINYMDTVLMTPDNETVYIPNRRITQSTVINKTTLGGIRISVLLTVSADLKLSDVEEALIEIGNDLKEELATDSKPEVRIVNMNERSVRLALLLRINNPAKTRFIASEVRKRAKDRIDKLPQDI
jgi:small conductance mechanosensitive channel